MGRLFALGCVTWLSVITLAVATLAQAQTVRQQAQERETLNGFFAAHQRLGRQVPLGRDVVTGHVEPTADQYIPKTTHPFLKGVNFVPSSGPSAASSHATGTASIIYGQGGLAPGTKIVHAYSTQHWLTTGYLNTGTGKPPRDDCPARVFNHSWISNDDRGAVEVLRRVDFQIDNTGVIMCVGVNNKASSRLPVLLGQAHNVITVGSVDVDDSPVSSKGPTFLEVNNRTKPDLVASPGLTSHTTAMVTAAVARLLEAADRREDETIQAQAARPETIKAVLMAGATKGEAWKAEKGRPLDLHRGAGRLNFDGSLQIHEAGPTGRERMIPAMGWDMGEIDAGKMAEYNFQLLEPAEDVVVSLNWHRRIDPGELRNLRTDERIWLPLPYTARMRLELVDMKNPTRPKVIADSNSSVDNVQHLWVDRLEPGLYQFRITRYADPAYQTAWRYAIAWQMKILEP